MWLLLLDEIIPTSACHRPPSNLLSCSFSLNLVKKRRNLEMTLLIVGREEISNPTGQTTWGYIIDQA